MKSLLFLLIVFFGFILSIFSEIIYQETITNRLINRRMVSHIIIETRPDHYRLVLLVNNRFPYNYKSTSYPFYIKTNSESHAIQLANDFDKMLDSGYNIQIKLNGSEIQSYKYRKDMDFPTR